MKIIKFAEDRQTFLFKAEKQLTMTDSEESSKETSKVEIEIDMITGTAAAMLYSDEEIRDVFSKEDADEFIELRRQVSAPQVPGPVRSAAGHRTLWAKMNDSML